MELPAFRYHPEPLATGSLVESDATWLYHCSDAAEFHESTIARRRRISSAAATAALSCPTPDSP
jgi:uncharacterized protein CbrC (UPF0167 family)